MNMNKDQIGLALRAGLELIGSESEVQIPAKLNDGIFFLKGLLGGIASGAISLSATMQDGKEKEPVATPGSKGPPADPKAKRQARKKASKKKTPTKKK